MEFSHIPVLLEQAVDALAVKENGIYVDGTAGGGGPPSENQSTYYGQAHFD